MLKNNDGEEGSLFRVVELLLLFFLNSKTNSSETAYVSVEYLECTLALNSVDKELYHVFFGWIATDEEDHSSISAPELKNKTELLVVEWLGMAQFRAASSVLHLVDGRNGISLFTGEVSWSYHQLCINRLYRGDLVTQEARRCRNGKAQ